MKYALLFLAVPALDAAIIFSIAGDSLGVPNQLVSINTSTSMVTPLATLGDGTQGYAGGIAALTADLFAGLQTVPGRGSTSQVQYNTAGTITSGGSRPEFQGGGMAVAGLDVVVIENDSLGNSNLVINGTLTIPIGTGFVGGLAYRATDNRLYAIRNDSSGVSTLHYFDPRPGAGLPTLHHFDTGASAMVELPIVLGSGFYGGLAWDAETDHFFAIGSDSLANGTLYRFAPNDAAPAALFGVGQGHLYAAMTVAPAGVSPVPEPSTFALILLGGVLVCVRPLRSPQRVRGH